MQVRLARGGMDAENRLHRFGGELEPPFGIDLGDLYIEAPLADVRLEHDLVDYPKAFRQIGAMGVQLVENEGFEMRAAKIGAQSRDHGTVRKVEPKAGAALAAGRADTVDFLTKMCFCSFDNLPLRAFLFALGHVHRFRPRCLIHLACQFA